MPTWDPLGRPADGEVLLVGDTAYVESAQACGLHLLAEAERDPKVTTSYGLGPLLAAAVEAGRREVVVGLGGSATNDGGAGMLAALGAAPLDAAGYALPYGGAALLRCAGLGGAPRLRAGAPGRRHRRGQPADRPARRQRGLRPAEGRHPGGRRSCSTPRWSASPACWSGSARLPGRAGRPARRRAPPAASAPRCSPAAAGWSPASAWSRRLTGLDAALDAGDLVITGEGAFDHQSLRGKVVAGVAAAARDRGLPCVVVAGRVDAGRREAAGRRRHRGARAGRALRLRSTRRWPARPRACATLGGRLARQWSRAGR